MKRLCALALAVAGCSFGQSAQQAAQPRRGAAVSTPKTPAPASSWKDLVYPQLRPIAIPGVEAFTLPNGMKVFLLEDHELPLVDGTARIRTGNLFDPPDRIGLATITGMVLRTGGTHSKTGDQLNEELENIAASVESNIDETLGSVTFSCLKENTDEVLAAFHDILTGPEFRQDKLDLARTQMNDAIARRNDEPQGIAEREFANTIYGKSTPYGWEEEYATINRISRSDLEAFYRRYFFPANTMLAVWGDFNTADMKERLENLFAGWTVVQPAVPAFPAVAAKPAVGVYLAAKSDVTQTFFSVGQLGGVLKDEDYPALEIMSDILGGGFQSRLFRKVRTEMGDAYEIGADWAANYDHPGLFTISGSTKSVSTVETLHAILDEVERIRTAEVTEQELKSARDSALNSLVFAFDTKAKTLGRILNYEYYGYPRDFIERYQRAIAAVTRADVLRVARQYLAPADFTIVAVGNPDQFGQPLAKLSRPVTAIDLTIPPPVPDSGKPNAASLEKGKQMLARVQSAVGGADKLAAVKDFTLTQYNRFAAGTGRLDANETDRWISPSHLRQQTRIPSGPVEMYSDGKVGWISNTQGTAALTGTPLKVMRSEVFHVYFNLLLAGGEGRASAAAVDDRTIEIAAGGDSVRLVIDPDTGLPYQLLYDTPKPNGAPQPVVEEYSDFREVNGIKVPFHVKYHEGGKPLAESTVSQLQINTGLQLADLERRP